MSTIEDCGVLDVSEQMLSGCRLPQELIDAIIDHLDDDLPSLESCSAANRVFQHSCRKRIFSRINLAKHAGRRPSTPHLSSLFSQLLRDVPGVAGYVQEISIVGVRRSWTVPDTGHIVFIIGALSRLTKLTFICPVGSKMSPELHDALYTLSQRPTFNNLVLSGLTEIPVTFFESFASLRRLSLTGLTFAPRADLTPESTQPAPASHLETLDLYLKDPAESAFVDIVLDPQTRLDISRLRGLALSRAQLQVATIEKLLSASCNHLEYLELRCK